MVPQYKTEVAATRPRVHESSVVTTEKKRSQRAALWGYGRVWTQLRSSVRVDSVTSLSVGQGISFADVQRMWVIRRDSGVEPVVLLILLHKMLGAFCLYSCAQHARYGAFASNLIKLVAARVAQIFVNPNPSQTVMYAGTLSVPHLSNSTTNMEAPQRRSPLGLVTLGHHRHLLGARTNLWT